MKGRERNQRCPCGSGKKYKKCHENQANIAKDVPAEVREYFCNDANEKKNLQMLGIKVNFVNPILFKGKKVFALGSRVFYNRPPCETFHKFILSVGLQQLGEDWWNEQNELAFDKKHFIAQCHQKHLDWLRKNTHEKNKIKDGEWSDYPDGWTRELISLAFDICSLFHTRNFPTEILEKIKNKKEYQSARYELSVAAIFARLDYDIEYLDENKKLKSKKHCEFIAKSKQTDFKIGVEVKSRHRQGVLHENGISDDANNVKGDIIQLLNKAMKQKPRDVPFLIFIDINSPLTPEIKVEEKQWFKDIQKSFGRNYDKASCDNPDPYNAIIFTNFSFHYECEYKASSGENFIVISLFPENKLLKQVVILDELSLAVNSYGNVPNIKMKK